MRWFAGPLRGTQDVFRWPGIMEPAGMATETCWHDLRVSVDVPSRCDPKGVGERQCVCRARMGPLRFTESFKTLYAMAVRLAEAVNADAVLLLLDGPADWARLKKLAGGQKVLVAADTAEQLEGAKEAGLHAVCLNMADSPTYDRLTQALLEAVADDILLSLIHI